MAISGSFANGFKRWIMVDMFFYMFFGGMIGFVLGLWLGPDLIRKARRP